MKRWSALLFLVTLLASCGREQSSAPGGEQSPATEIAQDGGTLVRRLASDINTLNFVRHNTASEKYVLFYLYDPLVAFNENLEIIPALASKWEISPDGKTYTFFLENATFSDGKPVRAADVVFTLRKIVDPASESAQLSGLFEGLDLARTRAVDDKTVEVVFQRTRAAQLNAFNIAVLPEHVYDKGNFKDDFNSTAVGSGPYKLVQREPGKQILLERRDDYWRKKPHAQQILFKVIQDDAVAWNALKLGDIDEMRVSPEQWSTQAELPQVKNRIHFHRSYLLGYNFIPWNTRDPLLADKRVRRALAMCLDRESIVKSLYHGTARIMTGPFTPDQWAYNPAVQPIQFDPAAAQKLFAEAGWKDSDGNGVIDQEGNAFELEMIIPGKNVASVEQAQIFQEALRQSGVKLNVTRLDGAQFFERITNGKFQTAFLGYNLDADPDLHSLFHSSQFAPSGQNFVFFSTPEVDQLIVQARQELDQSKRKEIYHRLHEILADEQPYTWTVQFATIWGVNKRVHGVQEAKGLGLYSWYPGPWEWWIPAAEQVRK